MKQSSQSKPAAGAAKKPPASAKSSPPALGRQQHPCRPFKKRRWLLVVSFMLVIGWISLLAYLAYFE